MKSNACVTSITRKAAYTHIKSPWLRTNRAEVRGFFSCYGVFYELDFGKERFLARENNALFSRGSKEHHDVLVIYVFYRASFLWSLYRLHGFIQPFVHLLFLLPGFPIHYTKINDDAQ